MAPNNALQPTTQEQTFQRRVAVHAAAAKAGHFARGVQAGKRLTVGAAGGSIRRAQSAIERLARFERE